MEDYVVSYNLIVIIMISKKFSQGFSILAQHRFYNNAFDWTNDKWSLSAIITPPQYLL